MNKNARHDN